MLWSSGLATAASGWAAAPAAVVASTPAPAGMTPAVILLPTIAPKAITGQARSALDKLTALAPTAARQIVLADDNRSLLFERPVKVGDLIQIGDAVGKVRRIGIRASVVRTHEGADIILPKGNLISNQITNWTYSDQRGSGNVTLNVAYGSDWWRVMILLKEAAAAALEKAQSEVYATAVNAASTSFVSRAWTTYTGDDLHTRIERSLA